jgi:hypothetical protein
MAGLGYVGGRGNGRYEAEAAAVVAVVVLVARFGRGQRQAAANGGQAL